MRRIQQLQYSDSTLTIELDDSTIHRFHAIWLRDNSLDPTTRSLDNGQRLVTLNQIDPDSTIAMCEMDSCGSAIDITFAPCATRSTFTASWLAKNSYDVAKKLGVGCLSLDKASFASTTSLEQMPHISWLQISENDYALSNWLTGVNRFGVGFVAGLPIKSGFICEFARRLGFIRETNYGIFFDVKAEVTPNNLAYTNLGLQAHTDNPYRDPVPTMQILYCLENSVQGGDSIIVDGLAIAEHLREFEPEAFQMLCRYPVRFAYEGAEDVSLQAKRPIIELGPDGELIAIRFNNRSAAPFVDVPFDEMSDFYRAYRRFAELVDDPQYAVSFKLDAGDAFIVDNTRVLHARKAFSGSGQRWLQGCYIDRDGFESTQRVLQRRL